MVPFRLPFGHRDSPCNSVWNDAATRVLFGTETESSYSLEEIAELVDSTVGGVKAALNRGRAKLASQPSSPQSSPQSRAASPELSRILQLYVDRFNRQDWDGIRELIGADARLQVADRFAGAFVTAPYFTNYHRSPKPWRLAVGSVDGEPAVIIHFWAAARRVARAPPIPALGNKREP
jgi:hypothetical protein